MVGTMWILGLRWRVLLSNTNASRSFFGASLSAGLLINYALPGPMGEIMGGWLLKREDNTPIVTGLTASTLGLLIGLFTAAIGSVILWWWVDIELSFAKTSLQMLILGIGCGGLLLIALSINADKLPIGYGIRMNTIPSNSWAVHCSNSANCQFNNSHKPLCSLHSWNSIYRCLGVIDRHRWITESCRHCICISGRNVLWYRRISFFGFSVHGIQSSLDC